MILGYRKKIIYVDKDGLVITPDKENVIKILNSYKSKIVKNGYMYITLVHVVTVYKQLKLF